MSLLGHVRAAWWTGLVASDFDATNKRGPSPLARWLVWGQMDAAVESLDPSLRWDLDTLEWASPKTSSIEGYSRVLMESKLISSASSRVVDLMVGEFACRHVRDRHKGSDLCELLFSEAVAAFSQDKVTKAKWHQVFPKILRLYRRKMMSPDERRTPLFTQQRVVYMRESLFVAGFRCCTAGCRIGVAASTPAQAACICHQQNSRAKEYLALMRRSSSGPESSTRNLFAVGKSSGPG